MNVLILGGGGREHALAWKIAQSPLVVKIFIAPGNAGTADVGENVVLATTEIGGFCRTNDIGLVVVGPDDLLAEGIVDALQAEHIPVFGPTKAAAQIEWSKAFAKEVMQEVGIPTAASETFTDFETASAYVHAQNVPIVIKASGLALGKGVVIAQTKEEAILALRDCFIDAKFGDAGKEVVIEEFLEGVEFSVHAICAGTDAILFPPAQDHKRIGEGDTGPNTGGMGTIAPVPIEANVMEEIRTTVVVPLLEALKERGTPFQGLLFPGIMQTATGPKVLEFNARFGDPETQSYMRLLKSDIVPALLASAHGNVQDVSLEWNEGAAACVVMASGGYPGAYEKGKEIQGAKETNAIVFHAGTAREQGKLLTNGGRVLGVTGTGPSLKEALAAAYTSAETIHFDGAYIRRDLGAHWF